jgi:hypothetical protein
MSANVEKAALANRAGAILRSDRQALTFAHRTRRPGAPLLVALLPDTERIINLMDGYMPDLAQASGFQYARVIAAGVSELPPGTLERTAVILAELSGQDPAVLRLARQALAAGRPILLAAQSPADVPNDLRTLPCVQYNLEAGEAEDLVQTLRLACAKAAADLRA